MFAMFERFKKPSQSVSNAHISTTQLLRSKQGAFDALLFEIEVAPKWQLCVILSTALSYC